MIRISLLIGVLQCVFSIFAAEESKEYCNGDLFNPHCEDDEMILMNGALYGQMSIGKCIDIDVGFLGCQANVLEQFDRKCSGKQSCEILVTNKHIEATGGCPSSILKYLLAGYSCVKNGLGGITQCSDNETPRIMLKTVHFLISNENLLIACDNLKSQWILSAEKGQHLNISVITLTQTLNDLSYGSLVDLVTNERVVIGNGPRIKHLLTSSANEVKLTLPSSSEQAKFILNITVFGCPTLTPPNGAWMTRDGDRMEIGCHSGEKTWTLHCVNNEWMGAIGNCRYQENNNAIVKDDIHVKTTSSDKLSINSLVFAACSVLILFSSMIFLIGACLFKSQHQRNYESNYKDGLIFESITPART